jgi:hypothetical protein
VLNDKLILFRGIAFSNLSRKLHVKILYPKKRVSTKFFHQILKTGEK